MILTAPVRYDYHDHDGDDTDDDNYQYLSKLKYQNLIDWLNDSNVKVNETIRDGLPILAEEMFAILDSGEVQS